MSYLSNKLVRGILCCCNPKINITNGHYVCGCNFALFTSVAEIENCLTGFTNKCKCLSVPKRNILDK